jgi:serine/threonine-protein kinase
MGIVYLALDPQIDRTIALKTIRFGGDAGGSFNQDEAKARFLKEARISGRLQHPNIVTVFDVGEDQGTLYLAMEYVSGGSLAQKLGVAGALSVTDRVRLVAEVADALAHAHERGVIHRDIKPANILLTEGMTAKVTDFGIGKLLSGDTELTSTGQMVGSPAYMSPEQIRGEKVDIRTDIFSLGVVLYQALTAKKPFPADTLTTLVYQILHEEPSDPMVLQADLPPEIAAVIKGCLAKKKDDRYADAAVLAEDLRHVIGISPVTSTASLNESRVRKARAAAEVLPVTMAIPTIPRTGAGEAGSTKPVEAAALSATSTMAPPIPKSVPAPEAKPSPKKVASSAAGGPGAPVRAAAILASLAILGAVGYFAKKELGKPAGGPAPAASAGAEVAPLPTFAPPPGKASGEAAPTAPPPPASPIPAASGPARATPGAASDPRPAARATRSLPMVTTAGGAAVAPPTKVPSPRPTELPAHDTLSVRKTVKVNVKPSQARVFLDGKYIGISDDWDDFGGGALITFSEGRHRFRFTHPGMKDLLIDVTFGAKGADDKIELDQKMEKGEPGAPAGPEGKISSPDYKTSGAVRFEVKPPDATVSIDGRPMGPASQYKDKEVKLTEPAVHDVVLSAPGYKSKHLRVIASASTDKDLATVKESLKKE